MNCCAIEGPDKDEMEGDLMKRLFQEVGQD